VIAIATVIAKNYLPFARVLADSLRQWHPELTLYVALADEPEGKFEPARERFAILTLKDLGIPNLPQFCFRYSRREAVSAVKPYLLNTLLDKGYKTALYLDADMLVLGDLSPLLERAAQHPLLVTPHTIAPGLSLEAELNILQCGVFNGGVVGASDTPVARAFLHWWQDRTREHCRYALSEGMHLDQLWLDLAPSFVPGLAVERDPAYNVAYWNVAERPESSQWRLFHFSGFDPGRPEQVSSYWPAKKMVEVEAAVSLFRKYAALIMAAGFEQTRSWPYAYDYFDNGETIPTWARAAFARLGRASAYFADPFGSKMREWLAETPDPGAEEEVGLWRNAAEERLRKLQEANILLGEQQVDLDRLRNELAGERQRAEWLAGQAAVFEKAAAERLALLENSIKVTG
jgi:hypothetical protein